MKRAVVDEKLFKAVKIMIAGGATVAEIKDYFNISDATVYRIRTSETHDEYKNMVAAIALDMKNKQKDKPEEQPKQTVIVQATWQMTQEMQKTNELLTLISNKLAYIVEQLT